MEFGEVIILIFAQGLWFGNRMEKILIKLYQCLDFEISIYDDPTDQYRPLRTEGDFNTHILMAMVGSACGFITQYTTDDQIETCQHIIILNEGGAKEKHVQHKANQ